MLNSIFCLLGSTEKLPLRTAAGVPGLDPRMCASGLPYFPGSSHIYVLSERIQNLLGVSTSSGILCLGISCPDSGKRIDGAPSDCLEFLKVTLKPSVLTAEIFLPVSKTFCSRCGEPSGTHDDVIVACKHDFGFLIDSCQFLRCQQRWEFPGPCPIGEVDRSGYFPICKSERWTMYRGLKILHCEAASSGLLLERAHRGLINDIKFAVLLQYFRDAPVLIDIAPGPGHDLAKYDSLRIRALQVVTDTDLNIRQNIATCRENKVSFNYSVGKHIVDCGVASDMIINFGAMDASWTLAHVQTFLKTCLTQLGDFGTLCIFFGSEAQVGKNTYYHRYQDKDYAMTSRFLSGKEFRDPVVPVLDLSDILRGRGLNVEFCSDFATYAMQSGLATHFRECDVKLQVLGDMRSYNVLVARRVVLGRPQHLNLFFVGHLVAYDNRVRRWKLGKRCRPRKFVERAIPSGVIEQAQGFSESLEERQDKIFDETVDSVDGEEFLEEDVSVVPHQSITGIWDQKAPVADSFVCFRCRSVIVTAGDLQTCNCNSFVSGELSSDDDQKFVKKPPPTLMESIAAVHADKGCMPDCIGDGVEKRIVGVPFAEFSALLGAVESIKKG